MLSLDSFSRLHFPDGCVRPKFRKELLDSSTTPQHAFEKQKEKRRTQLIREQRRQNTEKLPYSHIIGKIYSRMWKGSSLSGDRQIDRK